MVIDRGWCYLLYVLRLFHMLPRLDLPKASIGHRPNSSVVISSTDSKAVGVSAYSRNQIVFVGGGVVFGGWGARWGAGAMLLVFVSDSNLVSPPPPRCCPFLD